MNCLGITKKRINFIICFTMLIGFTIGIVTGFLFAQKVQGTEHIAEIIEPVEEIVEPLSSESYTITAYCGCEKCCGEWAKNRRDGVVRGAYGDRLSQGLSVAAPLPPGTIISIDGIGLRWVEDKTADWVVEKYDGKIIDIYFENHQDALNFGVQNREVFILD